MPSCNLYSHHRIIIKIFLMVLQLNITFFCPAIDSCHKSYIQELHLRQQQHPATDPKQLQGIAVCINNIHHWLGCFFRLWQTCASSKILRYQAMHVHEIFYSQERWWTGLNPLSEYQKQLSKKMSKSMSLVASEL